MMPPESVRQQLLHLLTKPLTLGTIADLPAHTDARRERHVDQKSAGERDLRRDARALRRDWLLGDLNDDVLAAL